MDLAKSIEIIDREHEKMEKAAQPELGAYEDLRNLGEKGWLTRNPPPRKYLFNYIEAFGQEVGFLPMGKTCMLASPGGCGKTFVLTHCALAAATGTKWLNAKATGSYKVLFVAAEEDESELWNRFHAMVRGLRFHEKSELLKSAENNIIALPQRGRNQKLIDSKGEPTKTYNDLKETIENNPDIKLVILDPAARFMGTDTELLNSAATDWVNLIDALTLIGGKPTVLVAHHTNKTALRPVGNDKKPVFDQSMCRGASALVDGFRWVLGLQRSELDNAQRTIFVKLLKSNYSKIGNTLEFEQNFETGGTLKLIGEVTTESLNMKKIDLAWEQAKTAQSYNAFSKAGESDGELI